MDFFKDFPRTFYRFGDEYEIKGGGDLVTDVMQDLTAYVDVIDQVKTNASFYIKYYIQEGERPDQLSQKLYGSSTYHWTFYLLNDNIRKNGWPLSNYELEKRIKKDFPHKTVTLRSANLANSFLVGQVAVGSNSGISGKVVRRNLDLGQVIIDASNNYLTGEIITSVSSASQTQALPVISSVNEYLSAHHYEDSTTGRYKDIDPLFGPGANDVEITQYDRYIRQNDELKQINIIKPSAISAIVASFKDALRS